MKKLLVAILMTAGVLGSNTTYADDGHLASFGMMNAATFNEEYQNRKIAQYALQQINGGTRQIYDPFVVDFFYKIANEMNSKVRQQSLLATPIINDNSINAFAVPGGLIGINSGTILASKSLDETASVLAHEIAHLSLRHYERGNDEKGKLMAMQLGGLLAALALSAASGDGAAMAIIGSQTLTAEANAAHSRTHEREADRVGMQIMSQSGFDVAAMPRFFDTLQKQVAVSTPKDAFIPSFVQTHPFSLERMSEATARIASYKSATLAQKNAYAYDFDLLYWRLSYLTKRADKETLKHHAKSSLGAKLALIAFLADKREFGSAKTLMKEFKNTDEPLVCITKAHIAYEEKNFTEAVNILSPCQAIYPERRDLALYLADSKLYAGDALGAIVLLDKLVKQQEYDLLAWDLLQKAYEQEAKKTANELLSAKSLQARAYEELWRGQYDKALISLTQAKTYAKDHSAFLVILDKDLQKVRSFKDFKP